jgi:LytR cell envelope-related transcriptional attenuator
MAAIPFALVSVHHIVSSVGAYVGVASLIAVALLVLLFFSQARETHTLRARADEAGQRIQELESEVADLAEQLAALPAEISVRAASPRAVGTVQPGVPVAASMGASVLPPAAPAGVGAPALAAATRLIPDPVRPQPEYEPIASAGNGNGTSARPVVAASAATMQRPVQAPPAGAARPVAAPPRVGTGGGGGGRPGAGRGPGAGQGRPPGAGQPRSGIPSRPPGAPLRQPPRRSWVRYLVGGVVAAAALAAVAVGVIVLTGGTESSSHSKSSSNAALTTRRTTTPVTAVQPATVTVSVLNGTDLQGLATKIADQLTAAGYKKGSNPTNAADQTHTSTIVAYMAPADRRDALAVANSLKLKASAVQLVDPTSKATVCPPAQACTSAVVVTVGQDLAQQ